MSLLVKKLTVLSVLVVFAFLLKGQNLYTDISLASNNNMAGESSLNESPVKPEKKKIPSDLDIVNLIGSCELSSLDYTLDTLGLDFEIIEHSEDRYYLDIAGAENNVKAWEIATEPCDTGKEKVTYVLIRYYHENEGDVIDLERYETKRSKKINDRKFIYNKSVGRQQSYFAVQISD
jgi:hypothetical protein